VKQSISHFCLNTAKLLLTQAFTEAKLFKSIFIQQTDQIQSRFLSMH